MKNLAGIEKRIVTKKKIRRYNFSHSTNLGEIVIFDTNTIKKQNRRTVRS